MQSLKRTLSRVCATSVPVLLHGDMCVGKSALSRYIHENSAISAGRHYLSLNCSALSDWSGLLLLDAALKPSTLVVRHSVNELPSACIGTLVLKQVCDLPPKLQQELSHLLAEHDNVRTSREQPSEAVRILCTSTQDLRREVKMGRFRRDLFDRLAVVTIEVPPLKKRVSDLPGIIDYLSAQYSRQSGGTAVEFSPELLSRMLTYSWPGNFCELESFVRRHVALKGDYSATIHPVLRPSSATIWDWHGTGNSRGATAKAGKRKM